MEMNKHKEINPDKEIKKLIKNQVDGYSQTQVYKDR